MPFKKAVEITSPAVHEGVCDASGAVALDDAGKEFVVADDEDKECKLRVYATAQSGPPIRELKLDLAQLDADGDELDLEAATWLGKRIFWIGSHSRDKEGAKQKSRRRLFATRLKSGDLEIDGRPYCTLIKDAKLHLAAAGKLWEKFTLDPDVPPKKGGLSIEGLAGDPEGELLIGLRSPLLGGKAVLLRLANPARVIARAPAKFGKPELLDLGGLGIRSLEYVPQWKSFLVLGGSPGERTRFVLFRWSPGTEPKPLIDFAGMDLPDGVAPEGLFIAQGCLYVLFDEGNRMDGEKACKKSKRKSFRSVCVRGLI